MHFLFDVSSFNDAFQEYNKPPDRIALVVHKNGIKSLTLEISLFCVQWNGFPAYLFFYLLVVFDFFNRLKDFKARKPVVESGTEVADRSSPCDAQVYYFFHWFSPFATFGHVVAKKKYTF